MIPHARAQASSASPLSIAMIESALVRRPKPTTSRALGLLARLFATIGTAVDVPTVARQMDNERLATTATLKRNSSQDPSTERQKLDPRLGHLDTGIVGIYDLGVGRGQPPCAPFPNIVRSDRRPRQFFAWGPGSGDDADSGAQKERWRQRGGAREEGEAVALSISKAWA